MRYRVIMQMSGMCSECAFRDEVTEAQVSHDNQHDDSGCSSSDGTVAQIGLVLGDGPQADRQWSPLS